MILVKKVEVEVVPHNVIQIKKSEAYNKYPHFSDISKEMEEIKELSEIVYGKRFYNKYNQIVCIGMTKEVQDAIGLPMETFQFLTNFNRDLQTHLNAKIKEVETLQSVEKQVKEIKNASFIKRLKYLFTKQLNLREE